MDTFTTSLGNDTVFEYFHTLDCVVEFQGRMLCISLRAVINRDTIHVDCTFTVFEIRRFEEIGDKDSAWPGFWVRLSCGISIG